MPLDDDIQIKSLVVEDEVNVQKKISAESDVNIQTVAVETNTTLMHEIHMEEADLTDWYTRAETRALIGAEKERAEAREDEIEDKFNYIKENAYSKIVKRKDFLYDVDFSKVDYDYAKEYFNSRRVVIPSAFGCSAIARHNTVGRHFDWTYDNKAEFVVRIPRVNNLKASINVVGNIGKLTDDFIKEGYLTDDYKLLPFYALDGLNEDGVFVATLVVPTDKGITIKTIPYEEERDEICSIMLPRYVLDHYSSASEAVEDLPNYISVYTPKTLALMDYETHFIIADKNHSYIVEFVNVDNVRRIVVREHNIVTNFYVNGVTFNANGGVSTPELQEIFGKPTIVNGITPNGSGLERYNKLNDLQDIYPDDVNGTQSLINSVLYTQSYNRNTIPFWYTEYVGNRGLTVDSTVDEYNEPNESGKSVIDVGIENYESRDRNNPISWQTTHASVYDFNNKELHLVVQEDGEDLVYSFKEFATSKELKNEIHARQTRDNELAEAISTEASRAAAAEQVLSQSITAETERATAKEEELAEAIAQAGKIDDVKVNGTSVVEDKIANVTVPTAPADLIPIIPITASMVIAQNPLTLQFDEDQDAIFMNDNNSLITLDATSIGVGSTTFTRSHSNVTGDIILNNNICTYNSSSLLPSHATTNVVIYRHSTRIGKYSAVNLQGREDLDVDIHNLGYLKLEDLPNPLIDQDNKKNYKICIKIINGKAHFIAEEV